VSARAEFAAALVEHMSTPLRVIDHARSLDAITAPVVMLERTTIAKAPNAQGSFWVTYTIHVIAPQIDPERQDDALDDAVDIVVVALNAIDFCNWSAATRSVFLDSWPSFQIAVETVSAISEGV
jgi:hypothetical protein